VLAEHQLAEIEQITRRFLEGKDGMEGVDRMSPSFNSGANKNVCYLAE